MRFETNAMRRLCRSVFGHQRRRLGLRPTLETLDARWVPAVVNPATVNLPIPATLTPHAWTPDSTGLYHTTTNLAADEPRPIPRGLEEWQARPAQPEWQLGEQPDRRGQRPQQHHVLPGLHRG